MKVRHNAAYRTLCSVGAISGIFAAALVAVSAAPAAASSPGKAGFDFTGSTQTWVVPDQVGSLDINATGGAGANGGITGGIGSAGANLSDTAKVLPGDVLRIDVGGAGGSEHRRDGGWPDGGVGGHRGGSVGTDGAGGGGSTTITIERDGVVLDQIIAGGGGGGGGGEDRVYTGGYGGSADRPAGAGGIGTGPGGCFQDGGLGGDDVSTPGAGGTGECAGSSGKDGGAHAGGAGGDSDCCIGGGGGGGGGGFGGGGGGGAPDILGGGGAGGGGGGSTGGTLSGVAVIGDGSVLIDYVIRTATQTSVTASPANPIPHQPITLHASVSPAAAVGKVRFTVDGASVGKANIVDGTADLTVDSALDIGSHTAVATYLGDPEFAESSGSTTIDVVADTTPPNIAVSAPEPPSGQHGYFNATDLANAAEHAIIVDVAASDTAGLANSTCTENGTTVFSKPLDPLHAQIYVRTDGTHAFACTATDKNGNSASDAATLAIDTTPPAGVTVSTSRPTDSGGYFNHPFTATWTGTDSTSGIASCTTSPYSGPDTDSGALTGLCTDQAGNSSTPLAQSFKYDATPPTTHINGGAAQITGTAADNLSGVATTKVTFAAALGQPVVRTATCTAGCGTTAAQWSVSTAGLNGIFTVKAMSVDTAGNTGPNSNAITVIRLGLHT